MNPQYLVFAIAGIILAYFLASVIRRKFDLSPRSGSF